MSTITTAWVQLQLHECNYNDMNYTITESAKRSSANHWLWNFPSVVLQKPFCKLPFSCVANTTLQTSLQMCCKYHFAISLQLCSTFLAWLLHQTYMNVQIQTETIRLTCKKLDGRNRIPLFYVLSYKDFVQFSSAKFLDHPKTLTWLHEGLQVTFPATLNTHFPIAFEFYLQIKTDRDRHIFNFFLWKTDYITPFP